MTDRFSNHSDADRTSPVSLPEIQPPSASPGGYAIASFVLGILSFAMCGPCAGVPAFVIGLVELRNIKKRVSSAEGKPFALIGMILGGLNSAFVILLVLFYIGIIFFIILAQGLAVFE